METHLDITGQPRPQESELKAADELQIQTTPSHFSSVNKEKPQEAWMGVYYSVYLEGTD